LQKASTACIWGFLVIVAFMCIYYMMFGVFSSIALGFNLVLLVAVLSMLQATLDAARHGRHGTGAGHGHRCQRADQRTRARRIAQRGSSAQAAIHAGYDRAWGTILDSNITTLIAGVALLLFGSGPVRGFAVVHCIGIMTSMFSAVFFSRGLVNLWYGRQKKLKSVSIGTVWKPRSCHVTPAVNTH
jgi:preprotein translocase subunit SecD